MITRSGSSLRSSFSTCSSCREISRSGSKYAARVARPRGGNNEYLIGRQKGLVASVNAGRMSFTRLIDEFTLSVAPSFWCPRIAYQPPPRSATPDFVIDYLNHETHTTA